MSAQITIRVTGQEETIVKIGTFEWEKRASLQKIVRKYRNRVRTTAKNTAPVSPSDRKKWRGSPGDLKKSISSKAESDGLSAIVYPKKALGWYRGIVEKGTVERYTKKGYYRGIGPAQPFMEPAEKAHEDAYMSDIKKAFIKDEVI